MPSTIEDMMAIDESIVKPAIAAVTPIIEQHTTGDFREVGLIIGELARQYVVKYPSTAMDFSKLLIGNVQIGAIEGMQNAR